MTKSSLSACKIALFATVAPVSLLLATPAFAQTATPADASATQDQPPPDVVVTGSRIVRPDLVSSSPVASIDAGTLKATNTVTVEQLLSANPQFVQGFGSASNNPGDGAATVDLRGLDPKRTLVLIDGKRAPVYDTQGIVDVNTIPTALISRVDVLTGGASSVYGSDAMAGVVNFILNDRFTGLRFDGSTQISSRGDAAIYDASLTGGLRLGDRGNLVISGGYSKRQPLFYSARPRNATAIDSGDLVSSAGSTNANPTIFDTASGDEYQITPSGVLSTNLNLYNFTPANYVQLPLERYNAMALGRYELSDHVELYGRANYVHSFVQTQLAPTATAGFLFNIDPTNPFLSASERAIFFGPGAQINTGAGVAADPTARAGTSVIGIRRRVTETGGRLEEHTTENYQFVGGLRGDLGGFNYDVFAQYGETKKHEVLRNDLSYTALQQALDVVAGPGGAPVCFNPANGCVPLNVFAAGTLTPAALAFVLRDATQDTKITEFVAGANIGGDLGFLRSPWADKPAAISVGVEYRRETGSTLVDPLYASGDLIYYGQGQNITGGYNVKEVYGEVKIPIIQDRPFFEALNLEGGYRYSDYSTAGGVSTYKAGGDWSPLGGLRFRGIYQRAVRAPNIYELYSPVVAATGSLTSDPCSGTVTAAVAAICIAQGAPASLFSAGAGGGTSSIPQPVSGQINIFSGGNPNLQVEKSDTYTLGVVFSPSWFRGFSATVDYYNIKIANAIDNTSPAVVVAACYASGSASNPACAGIVRNSLTGSLSGPTTVGVPATLGNVSQIKTRGIDVTVSYRGGHSDGFNYSLSVAGTYVDSYLKAGVECAGQYSSACNLEPIARWKHVADLNLGFGNFNFLTRWRYFGAVHDPEAGILVNRIPGFTYIDETFSADINDRFTFRIGVENLFDKKSPIVGDTTGLDVGAGSTFPNTYDVIGRRYFAGVSAKF